MGIFGSKALVWVPENEKLKEKCEDAESWAAKESFVGWRVQNDGKMLMTAIGQCESCSNLDLSYNGLGDKEAEALGIALKKNYSSNAKPFAGVAGAKIFGTIVKLNLSNNHIHALGVQAITKALDADGNVRILFCLEELNLANNSCGPEGAAAIGGIMKPNRVLRKINVAWNNIGNAGLKSIVGGMGQQHARGKIVIAFNTFDITELEFREWYGSEMPPLKMFKKLGIEDVESVMVGWAAAGLNDVVKA